MIKVINKLLRLIILTKEETIVVFLNVGCFQLETFF